MTIDINFIILAKNLLLSQCFHQHDQEPFKFTGTKGRVCILVWDTHMAAISLFWDTNMAALLHLRAD